MASRKRLESLFSGTIPPCFAGDKDDGALADDKRRQARRRHRPYPLGPDIGDPDTRQSPIDAVRAVGGVYGLQVNRGLDKLPAGRAVPDERRSAIPSASKISAVAIDRPVAGGSQDLGCADLPTAPCPEQTGCWPPESPRFVILMEQRLPQCLTPLGIQARQKGCPRMAEFGHDVIFERLPSMADTVIADDQRGADVRDHWHPDTAAAARGDAAKPSCFLPTSWNGGHHLSR